MATKKTETTVDTATMNVWQKLLAARIEFLRRGVTKSGSTFTPSSQVFRA